MVAEAVEAALCDDETRDGVAQLLVIARGIIRVSAQSLLETDHPGLLTLFERRGRVAAQYVETLQSWSDGLHAPAVVDGVADQALAERDLEARASMLDTAEARTLQLLASLLPRVADGALHSDLVKLRDLYLYVRNQPRPFIGTKTSI